MGVSMLLARCQSCLFLFLHLLVHPIAPAGSENPTIRLDVWVSLSTTHLRVTA